MHILLTFPHIFCRSKALRRNAQTPPFRPYNQAGDIRCQALCPFKQISCRTVKRHCYCIYPLGIIIIRRTVKRFQLTQHTTGKKFLIRIFRVTIYYRLRSYLLCPCRKHNSMTTGMTATSTSPAISRYRYFFFIAPIFPFLTYQNK